MKLRQRFRTWLFEGKDPMTVKVNLYRGDPAFDAKAMETILRCPVYPEK